MTPKKIISFALGPILAAVLSLLTLPMLTWMFNQEDIGRLSMLQVTISFSVLLFSLGLDQAFVREFHETKDIENLIKNTLFPGLILLNSFLLVLLISDNIISKVLFNIDSIYISIFTAIILISSYISRFLSLILRMEEKGLAYSMSIVLPKLILIIIVLIYFYFSFTKSFYNLILAQLISILGVTLLYAWNTRKKWIPAIFKKFNFSYLKQLLRFGVPLIFAGLAFWGLNATDKIMIKQLSTLEELGLYSVTLSIAASAGLFQSIFATVWSPIIYKWAATGEKLENIDRVVRYVLLVVTVIFSLVGLFSWIILFLLPESYNDIRWIVISSIAYPLFYTLSETTMVGLGITKRSDLSMLAAIIALVINFIGNWLLIPSLGAKGAAIASCVSFWIFFILRTEFSIYVWRPIPRVTLYSYTSILVIGAIFSTLYGKIYTWQVTIFWSIMLISSIFTFKHELKEAQTWILSLLKGKFTF